MGKLKVWWGSGGAGERASEGAGRKFEEMMVYTDVPVPCPDDKVSQKYTSQNSDVARYSMKKDVWSNPSGKHCWGTHSSDIPRHAGLLVLSRGSQ